MRQSRKLLGLGAAMLALLACNALSGVGDLETACTDDCGTSGDPDASDASIEGSTSPPADASDAAPSPDANADVDAGPAPLCNPSDPSLILCLPFDGNALDGSGTPLIGTATGVTYGAGHVAQAAFLTNGNVVFPYAPKLDVSAVTIEAFISPNALPTAGTRMGVVDSDGRFGMFLTETSLTCRSGGGLAFLSAPIPPAAKVSHVACVADAVVVKAYVNGVEVGSMAAPTAIPKNASGVVVGGNDPSGDPFVGMIDEFRIYNRTRTAAEIAADASRGK